MIRDLTDLEVQQLLQNQYYGHLSCCEDCTEPYLIPVTYAYEDKKIFTYSRVGKKIAIMRNQPKVCFQAEDITSDTSWQSAIVWGTYRELSGEDREHAFSLLIEKFWESYNKNISIYFPFRNPDRDLNENDMVLFAIDIDAMTGRMEEYDS